MKSQPLGEFEIIIGTYEDYIVGYSLCESRKSYELIQSFAIRSHSGSIKAIESSKSGKLLATAGHDEMVNFFELHKRKIAHTFQEAINCFAFVEDTHLIAGSNDGNIYIYELKSKANSSCITLVKTLKGHQKELIFLSVHPSNKILLSISKDNTMRTWNLIKGRVAFVTNIKYNAHIVKWSNDGNLFVIAADNEIYLYETSTGNLAYSMRLEKRVNAVEFMTCLEALIIACDNGKLEFLCLKSKAPLLSFNAHTNRIKSVRLLVKPSNQISVDNDDSGVYNQSSDTEREESDIEDQLVASCDSDGQIKVWSISVCSHTDTSRQVVKEPKQLAIIDAGVRITSMSTVFVSISG